MKTLAALGISLFLATLLFGLSSFAMAAYWSAAAPTLKSGAPDLVVEVDKKKNKNKNNNNDNSGKGGAETQGGAPADGGDHVCPAGYVTLDKPNKYGAFCEPKEGVCKKGLIGTPPNCTCPEGTLPLGTGDNPCVAKENCPFPGQVGNPPNCACPDGTEFVGYKGCVKYTEKRNCEVETADSISEVSKKIAAFESSCANLHGKFEGPKDSIRLDPGEKPMVPLCCVVRYYEK